jgi:hypothetical protein
MKHIVVVIALAAAAIVFGLIATTTVQLKAREHRMQQAEQMIDRLTTRTARASIVCGPAPTHAYAALCRHIEGSTHSISKTIRKAAAEHDETQWAAFAAAMQKLETQTEVSLKIIEGRRL